jgi:hypothetical protein
MLLTALRVWVQPWNILRPEKSTTPKKNRAVGIYFLEVLE